MNKIDKFYIFLAGVIIVLALPVLYGLMVVSSSITSALEIKNPTTGVVRVNKQSLERAVKYIYDREVPSFEIEDTVVVEVEEEVEKETE